MSKIPVHQSAPTRFRMANLAQQPSSSDFWMSGLAMLKYIPRSLGVKRVDGMAFFTEAKREEYRLRVDRITANNPRQWGTMDVAQMLHHLNLACGSSLGFYQVPDESSLLSRAVVRWVIVDWFPEQPMGLRLPSGFKISPDQHFNFESERAQLATILEAAWHARTDVAWQPHCMFGKMSVCEWGKLLQIHVDYHLRQFGA